MCVTGLYNPTNYLEKLKGMHSKSIILSLFLSILFFFFGSSYLCLPPFHSLPYSALFTTFYLLAHHIQQPKPILVWNPFITTYAAILHRSLEQYDNIKSKTFGEHLSI
jgi:hypothetical protein